MNLVDSSGWLEYFAAGPNANFFSTPLNKVDELVVPTISIYEVLPLGYSSTCPPLQDFKPLR
jgi:hypothetical protein